MHFGATLRLLRVDAGFTLRDLADRVGVSSAYLSRVENGHDAPPTPDRLAAIARTLRVPPTTLVRLADRIAPLAADYFEHVPAARELVLDLIRRKLTTVDIARVRAFVAREFPMPEERAASTAAAVEAMLDPGRVVVGLDCTDLDDVIDVAATRLASDAAWPAAEIAASIRARERACPSALGGGVAVPHAIIADAPPRAVVATLRRPLAIDTPDGRPLRLVVVHAHPGPPAHTHVLLQLAKLADQDVVDAAWSRRSPSHVLRELLGALA